MAPFRPCIVHRSWVTYKWLIWTTRSPTLQSIVDTVGREILGDQVKAKQWKWQVSTFYWVHFTPLWLLKMCLPYIFNDVEKVMSTLQKDKTLKRYTLATNMWVVIVHFSLCRRNSSQNFRPSSFDKEACLSGSQLVSSRSTAALWSWCFERNSGSWVFYCI